MIEGVYEQPLLQPSQVCGTAIEVDQTWGPFSTNLRDGDKCSIWGVNRLHDFDGLHEKFFMGVDQNGKVRFIAEISKRVGAMLRVYENLQVLTTEQVQEQFRIERIIKENLEVVVTALCK